MPLIPLQVDRASIAEGLENQHLLSETSFGRAIIQEYSATSMEFRTIVDDHSPHCQMVTFHVPSDTTYTFPCKFVFKKIKNNKLFRVFLSIAAISSPVLELQENLHDRKRNKSIG